MTASDPQVGILMGSPNDWPKLKPASEVLDGLGIAYEVRVLSAHRTPDQVHEYAAAAAGRGLKVLVGAAGMAAHLAGVLAAVSNLPVIGVPLSGGVADGLDALLATVQMPKGIPVATVAVDGAANAAWLSARIIALVDEGVAAKLAEARQAEKQRMAEADAEVQKDANPG
jgi:5-(carboxyamino)imidazole ribonucleotide mutase